MVGVDLVFVVVYVLEGVVEVVDFVLGEYYVVVEVLG